MVRCVITLGSITLLETSCWDYKIFELIFHPRLFQMWNILGYWKKKNEEKPCLEKRVLWRIQRKCLLSPVGFAAFTPKCIFIDLFKISKVVIWSHGKAAQRHGCIHTVTWRPQVLDTEGRAGLYLMSTLEFTYTNDFSSSLQVWFTHSLRFICSVNILLKTCRWCIFFCFYVFARILFSNGWLPHYL